MSHFTVTVLGDDYEEMLAGYYEQGDPEDWFMKFKSCQEEVESAWDDDEVKIQLLPDDSYYYGHDIGRLSEPKKKLLSSLGIEMLVHRIPDPEDGPDFPIFTVPYSYIYEDMDDFVSTWYGYDKSADHDNEYGYYHNPNAQWDWYQLGGRWSGYFKMLVMAPEFWRELDLPSWLSEKFELNFTLDSIFSLFLTQPWQEWWDGGLAEGYTEDQMNDICDLIRQRYYPENSRGSHGVFGAQGPMRPDYTDRVMAGDIDWVGMVADSVTNIEWAFEQRMIEMVAKGEWPDDGKISLGIFSPKQDYWEAINGASCSAATFAVLDDEGWHESGEMLWFGMAHNEKSKYDWDAIFKSRIEGLDPETWVNVVDCHI